MASSADEIEVAMLKRTAKLVCDLESDAIDQFTRLFSPHTLKKGEDFVREGDLAQKLCFVTDGLLRSYYLSARGEEHNKHFFLPGSFAAPLTSLVLKQPSPVYISALLDTQILVANHCDLESLYVTRPELNILGRKLVEFAWIGKEKRETQLIMLNATERYEAFLEEHTSLEDKIPQYHIASYLGITPVQLSRIRAKRVR